MLRTAFYTIFCTVFFFSLSQAQIFPKKNKGTLSQVKEHLQFEEYEDAIPHVRSLLDAEPNSAYYNFWMGKCLYLTYRKNQALSFFDRANEINSNVDNEFHYYYGLTLHYNLYFKRAIEEYKLDLERYVPNSADYLFVKNRIEQCRYASKLTKRREGRKVRINNMGETINTPYAEHSPVISANDSLLIFTARRPDCIGARPEDHFYDEDIYVSRRENETGGWAEAKNIGKPVNGKGHDATIALNTSGTRMYIYRHTKDGAFLVTDFDTLGKKWNEPVKLKKPFNSKHYEACIAEHPTEDMVIFSSDRPGGYGGRDLWMSFEDERGRWTEPVNLGPAINTRFDDDAPYIHPDGKTLYFSSNGPNSIGGFDIFVTEYDSSANNWLPPLNMGYPVNTPDDDIYFTISSSGKYGYYSSGKEGGFGEKDIYQIKFPYFPYPRRYHIVELEGLVKDVETLEPLDATVVLIDRETGQRLDSVNTNADSTVFYFVLEDNKEYTLDISADEHVAVTDILITPKLDNDDIFLEKNYLLEPFKEPVATVTTNEVELEIMNVYFDFDKYNLRNQSKEELDEILEILTEDPETRIELIGHTDYFGTYEYNVKLSENRSKSVREYLLAQGLNPNRISYRYESENSPIETNHNDQGRQFNRRTELKLMKAGKVIAKSKKLRSNMTEDDIPVDHTTPKGEAGYDGLESEPPVELGIEDNASGPMGADAMDQGGQGQQQQQRQTKTEEVEEVEEIEEPEEWTPDEGDENNLKYALEMERRDAIEEEEEEVEEAEAEVELTTKTETPAEEEAANIKSETEVSETEATTKTATVEETEEVASPSETEISEALEAFKGITLNHIYFDFDKYNLRQESRFKLDRAFDILRKNPNLTLEIYGHTDAHGSIPYNQRLSENRCKEAFQYLIDRGASKDQLTCNGFSELQPMDSNVTDGGRQNNRRVEFRFKLDGKTIFVSTP